MVRQSIFTQVVMVKWYNRGASADYGLGCQHQLASKNLRGSFLVHLYGYVLFVIEVMTFQTSLFLSKVTDV